jgi:hypothetical protein
LKEWAKKSINITELKKWQEAGEPFEEDDEVLITRTFTKSQYIKTLSVELPAFKEYKENEARKL